MSHIRAIPTRYNGVNFRSRLEVRWAAFFDLVGWKWEYEPIDLKGWAPDFVLIGRHEKIFVEVKPIIWPEKEEECIEICEKRNDLKKVRNYMEGEILILGSCLPNECAAFNNGSPSLGFLGEMGMGLEDEPVKRMYFEPASFWQNSRSCVDFAAAYGSYHFRISGEWDGDGHLYPVQLGLVESLWRKAGNIVQWQGL